MPAPSPAAVHDHYRRVLERVLDAGMFGRITPNGRELALDAFELAHAAELDRLASADPPGSPIPATTGRP